MKTHDKTTSSVDVALNDTINDSLVMRCADIYTTFSNTELLTRYGLRTLLHEIQMLRQFMITNDIKSYTYKDLCFTIEDDNFLDIDIV